MTALWLVGACALCGALALAAYATARPSSPLHVRAIQYHQYLERELAAMHSQTSPTAVLMAQLLATAMLILAAAAMSWLFILLAPLPFGITRLALRSAGRRRAADIERQLSSWLMAMANILKVSGSVADALAQSVELTSAPLGPELDRTVKEIRVGAPIDGALRDLAARVGSPMLNAATTTLIVGRRTGGALPSMLEDTANAARERQRLDRVFRQHLITARLQFFVLSFGPPLLIGGLDRVQPGFFDPLFDSPFGVLILVAAGVLWLVAVLIARRVMAQVV